MGIKFTPKRQERAVERRASLLSESGFAGLTGLWESSSHRKDKKGLQRTVHYYCLNQDLLD